MAVPRRQVRFRALDASGTPIGGDAWGGATAPPRFEVGVHRPFDTTDGTVYDVPVVVELTTPTVVAELPVTPVGTALRVREHLAGGAAVRGDQYVTVPAGDAAVVVDFEDLPHVDPTTLADSTEADAAWAVLAAAVEDEVAGIPQQVAAAVAADSTVTAAAAAAVDTALADVDVVTSEPIDDELGWDVAFYTLDTPRRLVFGVRSDGTTYPATGVDVAPLLFVGDSLTQNWGSNATTLASNLGRTATNIGIGGQTSTQIAARQGGVPVRVTVTGNTIPASGSVTVTDRSVDPGAALTGTLAGIPGVLNGTTFTRSTAGVAVPCPPGAPFQTGFAWRDHIPIVCVGRNNFKFDAPATVVGHVRAMLAWSRHGEDALVLSVPPWDGEVPGGQYASIRTQLDALNTALRDAFPERFIDTAAHLRSEAVLQSQGITPTATDTQNIADGMTPASFRTDSGHYNAAAYAAITALLTQTLTARGLAA